MRGLTLGDPALLGAAAGFSPLSLSPALWLDASDAATITSSGGLVSQWNDKSGNGRNVTQATSTRQPRTATATVNGLNVLSFDGGDDMSVTTSLSVANTSMFIVARQDVNSDNAGLIALAPSTGSDFNNVNATVMETGAATQILNALKAFQASGGFSTISGSGATPIGVYAAVSSTTALTSYSNTATGNTATLSATFGSCSSIVIGARFSSGVISATRLNGVIGEVLVFPSALSISNLNNVGRYLSTKWGLSWTDK